MFCGEGVPESDIRDLLHKYIIISGVVEYLIIRSNNNQTINKTLTGGVVTCHTQVIGIVVAFGPPVV